MYIRWRVPSSRHIYGCSLTAMKPRAEFQVNFGHGEVCSHPAHRPYIIRAAWTMPFLLSRTVERHSRGLSHLAPPRTRLARETRKSYPCGRVLLYYLWYLLSSEMLFAQQDCMSISRAMIIINHNINWQIIFYFAEYDTLFIRIYVLQGSTRDWNYSYHETYV